MTGLPNHSQGAIPSAGAVPPVPVFNCVLHVTRPGANGVVVARAANLEGIEGRGSTQREAIAQAVAAFKATVARYHARGEAIPFLAAPSKPSGEESELLIAVHL